MLLLGTDLKLFEKKPGATLQEIRFSIGTGKTGLNLRWVDLLTKMVAQTRQRNINGNIMVLFPAGTPDQGTQEALLVLQTKNKV